MPVSLRTNALLDLETVKRWLQVPTADTTQDDILKECINDASDIIEQRTSRKLKSQSVTEYHTGRNQNRLLFKQWPATAIAEVWIDNDSVFTDLSRKLDSGLYRISDGIELVLIGRLFPRGENNVKVVYTAGYSAPIPATLERAAKLLVEFFYQSRTDRRLGQTSKSKGGENVGFVDGYPKEIIELIDLFARSEFANLETNVNNS